MSFRLDDDGKAASDFGTSPQGQADQEVTQDGNAARHPSGTSGTVLFDHVRSWTIGNITTAATVLLFAFILVKVMIVSRGESATARALIEGAAPVAVLMDAALTLMPLAVAIVFVRVAELYFRSHEGGIRAAILTVSFLFLMYLVIDIVSVGALIGAGVGWLLGNLTDRRNRRRGNFSGVRLPVSSPWSGLVLGIVVVTIFSVMNSGLWVPTENVYLKGGRHHVAYVISIRDGWVTLFDAPTREIIRERAEDVERREICRGSNWTINKPIIRFRPSSKGPHYPPCKRE